MTEIAYFWDAGMSGLAFGIQDDGTPLVACTFNTKEEAKQLWDDVVSKWGNEGIRISFIDYPVGDYVFILYHEPAKTNEINVGFYRSLSNISGQYDVFRKKYSDKCYLQFAQRLDNNSIKPLDDQKIVTNVKFMAEKEVKEGSIEDTALKIRKEGRKQEDLKFYG